MGVVSLGVVSVSQATQHSWHITYCQEGFCQSHVHWQERHFAGYDSAALGTASSCAFAANLHDTDYSLSLRKYKPSFMMCFMSLDVR